MRVLLPVFLVVIMMGCESGSDESGGGNSAVVGVSTADIESLRSKRSEASKTDVFNEFIAESIAGTFAFNDNFTSEQVSDIPEEPRDCSDDAFDAGVSVSANGPVITVLIDVKLSEECIAEKMALLQQEADSITNGTLSASAFTIESWGINTVICNNLSSDINGKTIEEAGSILESECPYFEGFSSNSRFVGAIWTVEEGATDRKYTSQGITSTLDGGSCLTSQQNEQITSDNDCYSFSYSVDNFSPDETIIEYRELVKKQGLTRTVGPHEWYDEGTIEFVSNDLNGKLTFLGKDTPPEFEVTDGTETFSGTLTPSAFFATKPNQGQKDHWFKSLLNSQR